MRTLSAREARWYAALAAVLVLRFLFPVVDSPLAHLFSDPQRHWNNAGNFLHPDVIGAGDPFMYQLWLFALRGLAGHSALLVQSGCGLLCAAMPYGWYRALRELMPRTHALASAVAIGLWPPYLGPYAYFMTETLLLALTGFAFWLTLRALRKRTTGAFVAACALWAASAFTRLVLLPIALVCLGYAWWRQPWRARSLALGVLPVLALFVPAGLHARSTLGFFCPLGNLYLNEIYLAGGSRNIQLDFGERGIVHFGSPSYYNPTFYPFSDWTTARQGTLSVRIDTRRGREDWRQALEAARAARGVTWRDALENLAYLFFGQAWPDNDRRTVLGLLEVWLRWLVLPGVAVTALACARGLYRGREWLLPASALLGFCLLAQQREATMEGRYRTPLEPIMAASIALALSVRARAGERR